MRWRCTGMFILASQFGLALFGGFLLSFRLLIYLESICQITKHMFRNGRLTQLGLLYRNLDRATREIGRGGCASHGSRRKSAAVKREEM